MEDTLSSIKKGIDEIKVEITFIKEHILDDEAGLEISDEVLREVEASRKKKGKDLVSHKEVFKKYCR